MPPEIVWVASAALGSLVLTLLVEVPIAAADGFRSRRELLAIVCVNLVTNPPLVWLLFVLSALLGPANGGILFYITLCLEVAVVVIEWRLLVWALGTPSRKTLSLAIVMNVASYLASVFVAALLPALLSGGFWSGASG